MRNVYLPCSITMLLAFLGSPSLIAWQEAASVPEKAGSSQPATVLRSACRVLADANCFQCNIVSKSTVGSNKAISLQERRYKLRVCRPNRLQLACEMGSIGATVISDGQNLFIHEMPFNRYCITAAPPDLDQIFTRRVLGRHAFAQFRQLFIVDSLVMREPFDALLGEYVLSPKLAEVSLDKLRCHLLELSNREFDLRLWITIDDKPLFRRVEGKAKFTLPQLKMHQGEGPPEINSTVDFGDWLFATDQPDSSFGWKIPSGAQEIDAESDGSEKTGSGKLGSTSAPAK